jgi:hypothetical protein
MSRFLAYPSLVLATALVLAFPGPDAMGESRVTCGAPAPDALVTSLVRQAPGLEQKVLRLALDAKACAAQRGFVKRQDLLTVIDYSIPSDEPRLFTFDLASRKLLFRELVAHGKNSGGNLPDTFSNVHGSLATSLGLFVTAGTYVGSNGYSLKLRGLEKGVNDNAWDRAIVMHGAPYVNPGIVGKLGRLGRSWGCPAVRTEIARKMIDTIKGGSAIFAYYPDSQWLSTSAFLSQATRVAEGNSTAGPGATAARR